MSKKALLLVLLSVPDCRMAGAHERSAGVGVCVCDSIAGNFSPAPSLKKFGSTERKQIAWNTISSC